MRHQGSGYQEATRQSMTQESSSTSMMTQQFTSTSSSTTTNTQFQTQQQKQLPASILKNSLAASVALDAAAPAVSPVPRESPVSNTEVGPGQNMITPRRGKGVLTQQQPGMRVPICACGACQGPCLEKVGDLSEPSSGDHILDAPPFRRREEGGLMALIV